MVPSSPSFDARVQSEDINSVIATDELWRRPARTPNFEAENRALTRMARALGSQPSSILQTLAETARELCGAQSAGISIVEVDDGQPFFRWQATAGVLAPLLGSTMPRDFSPCGTVLDRNAMQLMSEPARYFPYIHDIDPPVHEVLLVPFFQEEVAIGTLWVVFHDLEGRFNPEDVRILESLSQFASAAFQMTSASADAEAALCRLRKTESNLRTSEDRLRIALDSGELGTWHIDPETSGLCTDERFRRIVSGRDESISYEQAFDRIHPEDRDRVRMAVEAAIRPVDPKPYAAEYRVVHPDGATRWVFGKGRVNFLGEGPRRRLRSFDGTVADITERKDAEETLRQLAADLSEGDRRKSEFLATLAHELRNPLAPISNALQILHLVGGEDEQIQSAAQIMERQVRQMVRLVDDLLDISRISLGKVDLRLGSVDVAEILSQAIEQTRPAIEAAGHRLNVVAPSEPVVLNADRGRLAQAVANLLNNSCKYSDSGGQIDIFVERQGDTVLIRVRDAGVGIAPEMLPRVFDLFTQVDQSLSRSQGGLGIGLSLVRSLVEMHGGTVTALSGGLGMGSEFTVQLPATAGGAYPLIPQPACGAAGRARRILVVDDNRDSALSLARLLQHSGHVMATAHDGLAALAEAAEFRPEVVVLDIGLPGLNGYEVAREIRRLEWGAGIGLIALTGWGQDNDREKSAAAGFDTHLVKPVDYDALVKRIADLP